MYCSDPKLVARKADILLCYLLSCKQHRDFIPYLSLMLDDGTSSSEYLDILFDLGISYED